MATNASGYEYAYTQADLDKKYAQQIPRIQRSTGTSAADRFPSTTNQDWSTWGRGTTKKPNNNAINDLIKRLDAQSQAARAANLARYDEAMGIYNKIEAMYQPGGAFQTSAYAELDRMKNQDLASAMQNAVDAGLSKTTGAQYASQRWTEQVGAPAIQKIQAQAQQLQAQAMGNRAAFIERREDVGPDYATIAQLTMAAKS